MAAKLEVYKCEKCGNIVEVLHGGAGTLVCCGEDMVLLKEQTADATTEKHVPVMEKTEHGVKVKVGSVPHPMEDKHHIEWIEVVAGGKAYREFLKPGAPPEATFCIEAKIDTLREYCNVHGLWKANA
ncbi:MAG: desulfoferrodoxin [Candidatus Eisenbacteria bacterium]